METKPILLSGEEVRAVLDGRQTHVHRPVNPQPDMSTWKPEARTTPKEWRRAHRLGPGHHFDDEAADWNLHNKSDSWRDVPYTQRRCPYGSPGDRLWARETWRLFESEECGCSEAPCGCPNPGTVRYLASDGPHCEVKWKPSVQMKREHSRILLEVVSIRVERVQEISEADSLAGGIKELDGIFQIAPGWGTFKEDGGTAKGAFKALWDSINAKRGYGWDTNCWVWVVEFKRVESQSDTLRPL